MRGAGHHVRGAKRKGRGTLARCTHTRGIRWWAWMKPCVVLAVCHLFTKLDRICPLSSDPLGCESVHCAVWLPPISLSTSRPHQALQIVATDAWPIALTALYAHLHPSHSTAPSTHPPRIHCTSLHLRESSHLPSQHCPALTSRTSRCSVACSERSRAQSALPIPFPPRPPLTHSSILPYLPSLLSILPLLLPPFPPSPAFPPPTNSPRTTPLALPPLHLPHLLSPSFTSPLHSLFPLSSSPMSSAPQPPPSVTIHPPITITSTTTAHSNPSPPPPHPQHSPPLPSLHSPPGRVVRGGGRDEGGVRVLRQGLVRLRHHRRAGPRPALDEQRLLGRGAEEASCTSST